MPVSLVRVPACLTADDAPGRPGPRPHPACDDHDVDPLGDVFLAAGARGSLGNRIEAGGAWGLWLDSHPGPALHVITEGTVWLTVPGSPPRPVPAGDAVIVPAGVPHGLSHEPGARMGSCDSAAAGRARATGEVVRLGSGPVSARLVSLHYAQDSEVLTPLLGSVCDVVHLRADDVPHLQGVLALLGKELALPRVGTTASLNSLIDLVLIESVRGLLDARPDRLGGWLGAPLDAPVRDALVLIHRDPAHAWTTANLATAVNVSRATLARRFPAATGCTPGAYLTRWRMDLAAVRLRDTEGSVEAIARSVGYSSVHAFSRAFHRDRGAAPGAYRRQARAARVAAAAA